MHAVVVIGGAPLVPAVRARLVPASLVVVADSGLDHALALGLRVDVVVGDLDSASTSGLAAAEHAGAEIERHPPDKDATDTELALEAARARGADAITLVSGGGGRLDHVVGTLAALTGTELAGRRVDAWVGEAWVGVARGPGGVELSGRAGEYVSLVPWGGPAAGVRTEGLRWGLDGASLDAHSTLGISNELVGERAAVSLDSGVLLVIRPDALARTRRAPPRAP